MVQSEDYYPFGLSFNKYQREGSVPNTLKLFQDQEHVDDLGLNWDSFKWRNHQPDIGRFFNVDPLAEKYYYNSPYAFSENKVVAHIELEGLEAVELNRSGTQIQANWLDQNNKVECSTTIYLPAGSTQSQMSDQSADAIARVGMNAGESDVHISSVARDGKGQAEAMFNNAEKAGGSVNALKADYGTAGKAVADVYGHGKAMQGTAKMFGGTVTDKQVKGMMEKKINELGASNVTKHAADPKKLQVFDIAPAAAKDKEALKQSIINSTGPQQAIQKNIFPGPGRSERGYHVEIPQKPNN